MFLTERKREILRALEAGAQDLGTLTMRLGFATGPMRDELRGLRSEQLVRSEGELWELTERARRELIREAQLELRGISA